MINRIYQGRISRLELAAAESAGQEWRKVDDSERLLWGHHELFQDAVNYYTLCLAGLASKLDLGTKEGKALAGWRSQVEASWKQATRRAIKFHGPHERISAILGLSAKTTDFKDCADAVLKGAKSTRPQMGDALIQLLREADKSDLNQLSVGRMPWLCSPKGQFDGTPTNISTAQAKKMLKCIQAVHEAKDSELPHLAFNPGVFLTKPPTDFLKGTPAKAELWRILEKLGKEDPKVAALMDRLDNYLEKKANKELEIPCPGRRPKGVYPYALLFSVWPCSATAEIFKEKTKNLKDRTSPKVEPDAIAEARVADTPLFDYFTNKAFYRSPDEKNRAVWFEFDLAAFIEAIKSPHRYFQDTLAREAEAEILRARMAKIEGKGGKGDHAEDDDYFGFQGDSRIDRLKELIAELAHETEGNDSASTYSISERTLRGWREIRRQWREEARKGVPNAERLLAILNAEQAAHRDDFGDATLYRKLIEPKYHCIWRDPGTKPYHAAEPLEAWKVYKEIEAELTDTERPIRFTPAHPEHSPRYFIFPHKAKAGGKFGSSHETADLAFTSGLAIKGKRGWEPARVRIAYSAPRLRRDQIFQGDAADGEWLQPMMKALGLDEPDQVDLSATRILLNVSRHDGCVHCQLSFPVAIDPARLQSHLGKKELWDRQFNTRPDGDAFRESSLRWPHENAPKPPKGWLPWHAKPHMKGFRVLAIDLGQRDAGAYALLRIAPAATQHRKPGRHIGEAGGKRWRAELSASGLLRLPGEGAQVWREASAKERQNGDQGSAFRPELWGEAGRPALPEESQEAAQIVDELGQLPGDFFRKGDPAPLSFPHQNDELLRAARRAQSWCARLHRWVWMLSDKDFANKETDLLEEIAGIEGNAPSAAKIREAAKPEQRRQLITLLTRELNLRLHALPSALVKIANRIAPLRGRAWEWGKHPQAPDCYFLDKTGESRGKQWLRGQRGLSFPRIEQIEELRRRFQSLNQQLRRKVGSPAPKRRDETIPDPCPDLLEKLDRLKRQRVNQTAHLILCEALGLKLTEPPANKMDLRRTADVHGAYQSRREVADFIVIEDLSRYRASQGRAPRENSRLMKWCHRAVRDKLRELAEPFGLPILEAPAAYSSRFCSRSGVPGFRAREITEEMATEPRWERMLTTWADHQKGRGKPLSPEAVEEHRHVAEVFQQLREAEQNRGGKPPRTLLAPASLGPIFVPLVGNLQHAEIQPAIAQADINAAINLGLRAVADPRLWSIHPRVRSDREPAGHKLFAREKRKYGEKNRPEVQLSSHSLLALDENKNPNFFADCSTTVQSGLATIPDPITGNPTSVVWSKALWSEVKTRQWSRIQEINLGRLSSWKKPLEDDDIPL